MGKPLFSAIYFFSTLCAGLSIHQAFAERSPAVTPLTEVSIEENQKASAHGKTDGGFNFSLKNEFKQTGLAQPALRVPANIAVKPASSPYSYVGPLLFILALPMALWIIVSNKLKNKPNEKKIDYFSKTHQFKYQKSDYQETDIDDDQDLPKAS